jgi:hypothetical protein
MTVSKNYEFIFKGQYLKIVRCLQTVSKNQVTINVIILNF